MYELSLLWESAPKPSPITIFELQEHYFVEHYSQEE